MGQIQQLFKAQFFINGIGAVQRAAVGALHAADACLQVLP